MTPRSLAAPALLAAGLFSIAGCGPFADQDSSDGGDSGADLGDYVGMWVPPLAGDSNMVNLQVNADGSCVESSQPDDVDPQTFDGTCSFPSPGVLDAEGVDWALQPGCGLLASGSEALVRNGAPSTCSIPEAPLSDAESCILGTFSYNEADDSGDSEQDYLTLYATRVFVYTTATSQSGVLTQTGTAGTWAYGAGTLTLSPTGQTATPLSVTTQGSGQVCFEGECFQHGFAQGCGPMSL